ncbi:MAG: hypothetical protein EOO65_01250 [Methanosarcinales archaeon]|nr:MAG: hypothetical protein EOO65_01250 [Methanosarcinales archaeon]
MWVPRLPVDVVNASLVPLLTAFFALMTKPGYRENEYLMRSLSRIVLFVKAGVVPVASQLIAGLSMILTSVRAPAHALPFPHTICTQSP